ncbi:hypothetical protein SAMN05216514_10618 [Kandleria vitulina]|uniref:P-loop NTPase fold protein n=1 Tax=Kandleria vitulina TaxID=1630 RepID=UPI0008C2B0C6|nr:P-loop NTPase fold protein [Kandleria vitulina]SEI92954.1 hypothetical protein SAMN05216514_10618 [Kandleria vitulina]
MNEEQIEEEVLRYLRDQSYNYAVLIDGDWGSGKTYFASKRLISTIENAEKNTDKPRKVKYLSLYGCKNLEDIQENIAWGFAEDARKLVKKKRRWGKNGNKISSNLLLSSKKIANIIQKKILPDISVYDIASDWLNMSSSIFMFDDLERCECPINELFGFFNDLVEHEQTKVILIANEKEISGIVEHKYQELQYLLAIDDRIIWPKDEKNQLKGEYNKKISIEEMERRRSILFPVKENNGNYKKIREKLIGVTLRFEPNIKEIITEIINTVQSDDLKSILLDSTDDFISSMGFYHHYNLRTFQFFLSKICYLLERVDEIEIDDYYRNSIINKIVKETFSCSMKFKSNWRPSKRSYEWFITEKKDSIQCIKLYVETGTFKFETFKKDLEASVEILKAKISDDDPCYLLERQYYINTQEWCEKKVEEVLSKLKNNKYPIQFYGKILIVLLYMKHLGFDEGYITTTKKYMLNNISHMEEMHEIVPDLWNVDDQQFMQEINEIVFDINEEIKNRFKIVSRESIKKILACEDWPKRLRRYINPNGGYNVQDMSVFSKAKSSEWLDAIKKASPADINTFRHLISALYPRDVKRSSYVEDKDVIQEIIKGLDYLKSNDLIKKAGIGWLKIQFEDIVKFQE